MNQTNAVIKNARKDGCGFELDDGWYSSFNKLSPAPNRGDVVSFDYKEKEVGGRTYRNIIEKTFSVSGGSSSTSPPSAGGVKASSTYSGGKPNPGFPIPTTHGNRAINRQSAIAQAVTIMGQTHTETQLHKMKSDAYVEAVVEIARGIEAYTTGDLDSEIVKKLLEEAEDTAAA